VVAPPTVGAVNSNFHRALPFERVACSIAGLARGRFFYRIDAGAIGHATKLHKHTGPRGRQNHWEAQPIESSDMPAPVPVSLDNQSYAYVNL
jgi:hypothetical protein